MAYDEPTVLDGTNPTLDAAELSYEFEKARIKGATDDNVIKEYDKTENAIMPENFQYLSSFRDPATGTSGVAFKDKPSGKTIIAFTGTNPNSDLVNDVIIWYCLWDGPSLRASLSVLRKSSERRGLES